MHLSLQPLETSVITYLKNLVPVLSTLTENVFSELFVCSSSTINLVQSVQLQVMVNYLLYNANLCHVVENSSINTLKLLRCYAINMH